MKVGEGINPKVMKEDLGNVEEINMKEMDKKTKDILIRLRKIQGQVKGIEKMVANESCCRNILVQVAAARSAINKVGGLVLENYAANCLEIDEKEMDGNVKELIDTLMMFMK